MRKDCRIVISVKGWHQNRVVCIAEDPKDCLRYCESDKKLCGSMDDCANLKFCLDESDLDLTIASKTITPLF